MSPPALPTRATEVPDHSTRWRDNSPRPANASEEVGGLGALSLLKEEVAERGRNARNRLTTLSGKASEKVSAIPEAAVGVVRHTAHEIKHAADVARDTVVHAKDVAKDAAVHATDVAKDVVHEVVESVQAAPQAVVHAAVAAEHAIVGAGTHAAATAAATAANVTRATISAAAAAPGAFIDAGKSMFENKPEKPKQVERQDTLSGFAKNRLYNMGKRQRLVRVEGEIVKARGLMDTDAWGKSDPYCFVKGIKGNARTVDIHTSKVIKDTLTPVWNEKFSFDCPADWGLMELVGLKFLVYDSDYSYATYNDDFLGGHDIDIADEKDFPNKTFITKEVELQGLHQKMVKGIGKKKKARLEVKIKVIRAMEDPPLARMDRLLLGEEKLLRVMEIDGAIISAEGLINTDTRGKSDPRCIVSVVMLNGSQREIYRTAVIDDNLNPRWDEMYRVGFTKADEPLLLHYDVYDSDEGQFMGGDDDHLGRASIMLKDAPELNEGPMQRFTFDLHALPTDEPDNKKRGKITIEIRARKEMVQLPNLDLMLPHQEDTHEVEVVLPTFGRRDIRKKEKKIQDKMPEHEPPRGEERIVCVYGRVRFAQGLTDTDLFGKSDPYCKVEAVVEGKAEGYLLHQTRVVNDDLNPVWNEAFLQVIPHNELKINRISFSIFDSDEGGPGGEDDFLGMASVVVSDLCNNQVLQEEATLIGCPKKKKTGKRTHGFRHDATVSFEIRVEWRVFPLPPKTLETLDDKAKRIGLGLTHDRHLETRRPEHPLQRDENGKIKFMEAFQDESQRPMRDPAATAGSKVLALRDKRAQMNLVSPGKIGKPGLLPGKSQKPALWLEPKKAGWRGFSDRPAEGYGGSRPQSRGSDTGGGAPAGVSSIAWGWGEIDPSIVNREEARNTQALREFPQYEAAGIEKGLQRSHSAPIPLILPDSRPSSSSSNVRPGSRGGLSSASEISVPSFSDNSVNEVMRGWGWGNRPKVNSFLHRGATAFLKR